MQASAAISCVHQRAFKLLLLALACTSVLDHASGRLEYKFTIQPRPTTRTPPVMSSPAEPWSVQSIAIVSPGLARRNLEPSDSRSMAANSASSRGYSWADSVRPKLAQATLGLEHAIEVDVDIPAWWPQAQPGATPRRSLLHGEHRKR